jgi:phage-related protein
MPDKALWWLGSSREDIRAFPEDVRRLAGFQLRRLQQGLEPNDWRPMPTIGPGVEEIRIHMTREHRVVYIAKFTEVVYVVHAFEKRSRKTPKRDLDLARQRLQQLLHQRRSRGCT